MTVEWICDSSGSLGRYRSYSGLFGKALVPSQTDGGPARGLSDSRCGRRLFRSDTGSERRNNFLLFCDWLNGMTTLVDTRSSMSFDTRSGQEMAAYNLTHGTI